MTLLARIRPRAETLHISGDSSVYEVDSTGMIPAESSYGLFVDQTRILSTYRYFVNDAAPQPVVLSNVEQNSWRGYYVAVPPGAKPLNMLQAILGLYPYAPANLLIVDPHLPEWLPEISLDNLRVGASRVSIRFFRKPDGTSDYEVTEVTGGLHVFQQPSPWSLSASLGERFKDALLSLSPSR